MKKSLHNTIRSISQFVFLLAFITLISNNNAFGQCSNVPVKEAVTNGDFEKGYLSGTGYKTATGPRDFKSDLTKAADFTGTNCIYGFGGTYGVVKNLGASGACGANYPYMGAGYPGAVKFTDHTVGKAGDGYALAVDFVSAASGSAIYTGGKPVAWAQDATITAGESYFFSAWFANYTVTPGTPRLYFVVTPYTAGGVLDIANRQEVGAINPTGVSVWQQFSASKWTPPTNTITKVQLSIEVDFTLTSPSTGADFLFDDISFINGCQNLTGTRKPSFPSDTINICSSSTSTINLAASFVGDPNTANNTITWYEGATSPQTVVSGQTALTYNNVSTPNTYRVCINDPDNTCPTSATVTVVKTMTATLPNAVLCSPPTATLTPTVTPSGAYTKNYTWSGSGSGSSSSVVASSAGSYTVNVTNPLVAGCSATATSNVTSTLPTAPTNLEYCDGGGTATNLVGGGTAPNNIWNWYSSSAKGTLANLTNNGTASATWTPTVGTTGDQVVYMSSNATVAIAGSLGPGTPGASYPASGSGDNITLTVTNPVQITSFDVSSANWVGGCASGGATGNATFTIKNGATTVATVTYAVKCGTGTTTVPVGVTLQPGTYTLSATAGMLQFGTMSGTLSNTSLAIAGSNTVFANIKTASSAACDPIPVTIKAKSCCTKPVITTQPKSLTLCPINAASFTVAATGTVPANTVVRWEVAAKGSKVWTPVTPATTALTYTIAANSVTTALDGTRYRAVLVSTTNCFAYSDSVTLTVKPTPATPQISGVQDYCIGNAFSLTASASLTTKATDVVKYVWTKTQKPSATVISVTQTGTSGSTATSDFKSLVAKNAGTGSPLVGGAILADSGTYVVVDSLNGCASLPSLPYIVRVKSLPSASLSSLTQTLCSDSVMTGVTVTLSPTTAKFDWISVDKVTSPSIAVSGNTETKVSGQANSTIIKENLKVADGTQSGEVTYTITPIDGSCVGTPVTHVVTVNPRPTAPIPSSVKLVYCEGDTIVLNSNVLPSLLDGTGGYKWTGPNGYNASTSTTANATTPLKAALASVSTAGDYFISVTKNKCTTAPVKITVSINPIPVALVPTAVSVCKNSTPAPTIVFVPINPTGLKWYINNTITTSSSTQPPISTATAGVLPSLFVTTTVNGCESGRAEAKITINDLPKFTVQGDKPCQKTLGTITLNTSGITGAFSYKWKAQTEAKITGTVDESNYVTTAITQTLTLADQSAAAVKVDQKIDVTLKDANGCESTETATIEVNPCPFVPDFSFAKDTACLSGSPAVAKVTITPKAIGATEWVWDFGPTTDYTTTQALASVTTPTNNGTAMNAAASPTPFDVVYKTKGPKTIKLSIKGPGSTAYIDKTLTFNVGEVPDVVATDATICSGATTAIALSSSNQPTSTFSWLLPISSTVVTGTTGNVTGGAAVAPGVTPVTTSIAQTLTNPTQDPGTLTYNVQVKGPAPTYCLNYKTVKVTVNPTPVVLINPDTAICSAQPFAKPIAITSKVTGATFEWTSVSTDVTGSAGLATNATTINETLTASKVTAGNVVYTIKAKGPGTSACPSATPDKLYTVTVKPNPKLLTTTSTGICSKDGTLNLALTSDVTGATYSWSGVSTSTSATPSVAVSGVTTTTSNLNNIKDDLSITGTTAGKVTYTVVTTAASCTTSTDIVVAVSARPVLTVPILSENICSSTKPSTISITTNFPTIISWSSPITTSLITGAKAYTSASPESGTTIKDVLKNGALPNNPGTAQYLIKAGSPGCLSDSFTVTITVDSCPVTANFKVDTAQVCDGAATVTYTDLSSTSADDWNWTFTNASTVNGLPGNTATTKGPHVVTYAAGVSIGKQPVTLVVQDKSKLPALVVTDTKTQSLVNINAIPQIANTLSEQSVTICSHTKPGILLKSNQEPSNMNTVYKWTTPIVTGGVTGGVASPLLGVKSPTAVIDDSLKISGNTTGTVTYKVTPELGGCPGTTVDFVVTVEPIPVINPLVKDSVCSGTPYSKTVTSTTGGSITWTRATVTGITEPASTGNTGTISETLTNTDTKPVKVFYVLSPKGPATKQCVGKDVTFELRVAPIPKLDNLKLIASICSGEAFKFNDTSKVANTTFTWTRAVSGTNAANNGNGNTINETLVNATTSAQTAIYVITPTGPAANSCVGLPTNVTVTVNPLPVITSVAVDKVCSNQLYTYNITTGLATAPTFTWNRAAFGTNQAKANQVGSTISETLTSTSVQVANYKINALTAAGCKNATDFNLNVTVNPLPTGKLSITPQICVGATPILTATVTGTAPFSYTVNDPSIAINTVNASNSSTSTVTVSPTINTSYTISNLTDATGCTSVDLQGTNVKVNSLPTVSLSGKSQICEGGTSTIDFVIGGTASPYKLTFQEKDMKTSITQTSTINGITTNAYQITVAPIDTTVYKTLSLTDNNGCKAVIVTTDSSEIDVVPTPILQITIGKDTVCDGDITSILLTANPYTTFSWTAKASSKVTGAIAGVGSAIQQKLQTTATVKGNVRYTITPLNYGCPGTAKDAIVFVRPKTIPNIGSDRSGICKGTKVKLTAGKFNTQGGTYVWTILSASTKKTYENRDTLEIELNEDTDIEVNYRDVCNKDNIDSATYKIIEQVNVDFIKGDTCADYVTTFKPENISSASNVTNVTNWKWNFGDSKDTTVTDKVIKDATHAFAEAGVYKVNLSAMSDQCPVGDTTIAVTIIDCSIKTKTAFTPSGRGNGQNDTWRIDGIENYPNASVEIFNRWGVLVHRQMNGYNEPWNGTNTSGELLEDGTYYYVITLNKSKKIVKGYVSIFRDNAQ